MTLPATLEDVLEIHKLSTSPEALDFILWRLKEAEWLLREVYGTHLRKDIQLDDDTADIVGTYLYGPEKEGIDHPSLAWVQRGKIVKGPTNVGADLKEVPPEKLTKVALFIAVVGANGRILDRSYRWHAGKQRWMLIRDYTK